MRIINDLSLRKFQGFGSSVLGSWDPGMKTPRIYYITTYTSLDVACRAFGEGPLGSKVGRRTEAPGPQALCPGRQSGGTCVGSSPGDGGSPRPRDGGVPRERVAPPSSVPGAAGKSVHTRTVASQGPTGPAREGSKWAWSRLPRVRCAVNAEMRLFEGVLPPRERGDGIWSAEREKPKKGALALGAVVVFGGDERGWSI